MKHWLIVILLALLGNAAAAARPAIAPFAPDSLAQIVKTHGGKPFVLILWSLDCVYCQASLTVLAQEKRAHPELDIVTLATDALDDPDAAAQVGARLEALGLLDNAWAFGAQPPEHLRYAVDPKWHGEMPRSYWFDAQGKASAHSGVLTAAMIAKLSSR